MSSDILGWEHGHCEQNVFRELAAQFLGIKEKMPVRDKEKTLQDGCAVADLTFPLP